MLIEVTNNVISVQHCTVTTYLACFNCHFCRVGRGGRLLVPNLLLLHTHLHHSSREDSDLIGWMLLDLYVCHLAFIKSY